MGGEFEDKDTGWADLCTTCEVNGGEASGFVGFLRSTAHYKNKAARGKGEKANPITVAQIAAVNEYGSQDGRIPERSFIRSTVNEYHDQIQRMLDKFSDQILEGKMTRKRALGIASQFLADKIRAKINSGVPPRNAASTVRRKGSSKTLVDTGQMLAAVDWDVKESKT